MANVQEWARLSDPDPEWQKASLSILDFLDVKLIYQTSQAVFGASAADLTLPGWPDIATMRQKLRVMKKAMTQQLGNNMEGLVEEEDHQVSMRDGARITCRVYRSAAKVDNAQGLLVVLHGGAWCIGGLENEELLCRLMASTYGLVCVNVDYRLAPENKFPVPFHDCLDATKWAATYLYGTIPRARECFIISGTSAGGNMAAGVTAAWLESEMVPTITGCHLMNPMLTYHPLVPEEYKAMHRSWTQNQKAPLLNPRQSAPFLDHYIPSNADRQDIRFNVLANTAAIKMFPPTYLQVSGWDAVRDDALIFERALSSAGRKTKLDVYPGQPHGFWSILPQMVASKKFVKDYMAGIQWLLGQPGAHSIRA